MRRQEGGTQALYSAVHTHINPADIPVASNQIIESPYGRPFMPFVKTRVALYVIYIFDSLLMRRLNELRKLNIM